MPPRNDAPFRPRGTAAPTELPERMARSLSIQVDILQVLPLGSFAAKPAKLCSAVLEQDAGTCKRLKYRCRSPSARSGVLPGPALLFGPFFPDSQ